MKSRRPASKSKDPKIFSRTASKTKAINLPTKIFRGGIRM